MRAKTLLLSLVVLPIVALLGFAILFPIFAHAKEGGRPSLARRLQIQMRMQKALEAERQRTGPLVKKIVRAMREKRTADVERYWKIYQSGGYLQYSSVRDQVSKYLAEHETGFPSPASPSRPAPSPRTRS